MFRIIYGRQCLAFSHKFSTSLIIANNNGRKISNTSFGIKFQNKRENQLDEKTIQSSPTTFVSLFRDSPFCQLGLPEGKIVIGEIVNIVEDDIYVDFGFKFLAVCRRPKQNSISYVRGAKVTVRINDLELSDRFLGSPQDMTLLEADVTLLGLHWSPVNTNGSKSTSMITKTTKSRFHP